jgi:pimeloyl-ACP methyl ester carboxylesterase
VSHSLLVLHGAIGSSAQLKPLAAALEKEGFDPKLFDFTGHGGREMPAAAFSIPLFADDVIRWMDEQRISRIDIFGYSMGGYVALYMARHYPERVGAVLTLATKFDWNPAGAEKEVKMLNPERIAEKIPKFAATLEQRHAPQDWKEVLKRTADMMLAMGSQPPLSDEDLQSIPHTTALYVGDKDTMVTIEETIRVSRQLKNARFSVLLETTHPIEQMDTELLIAAAKNFFA